MSTARAKRGQSGLTIVEIMVALTVSLLLLGGVLKVFANSKQTYRVQEALSRLQENGRFATQFLARDIRMGDFWGCVTGLDSVTNHLDPAGAGYIDFIGGGGLSGTDGATDTVTIRGAFGSGLRVQAPFGPLRSSDLLVEANNSLQAGDIVLVTDCIEGDIFQISAGNPQAGDPATVMHMLNGGNQPGNINAGGCSGGGNAHCFSRVYGDDAGLYRVREISYSILNGASGEPSLFRDIDGTGAVEMVEGVENMQVLYGEDVDGDGAPNGYIDSAVVANMANVVAIRITLTLRTLEDNLTLQGGGNDGRLRRNFVTTIALRNRLI